MADPLREDVSALCNHAGIDAARYKNFETRRNGVAGSSRIASNPAASKGNALPADEKQSGASSIITAAAGRDVSLPTEELHSSIDNLDPTSTLADRAEHVVATTKAASNNLLELPLPSHRFFSATHSSPAVADSHRVARDRWSAIQDVFALDTAANYDAAATHTLPSGSISLFAVGGGVGKTTIGATLARVLTRMGESVLLAGLTPDSILPMYFGARSVSGGTLRSFLMPRDHGRGSLHLYLDSLSLSSLEGGNEGQELLDRLCAQAQLVKDDVDRAILVFPGGSPERLMPVLPGAGLCLTVIVPDLVSAIGVGKLMRFLKEHQDQLISPYFLINKFDSARALHQEMRSRLHEQLGDHLLPVVIRRSDDIQDALAAGMTVIDYAPGAAVAQDFQHLAEWILGHSASGSTGQ